MSTGKKSSKKAVTSFKTPKRIFELTKEQKREIDKIIAWEKSSEEKNISFGKVLKF